MLRAIEKVWECSREGEVTSLLLCGWGSLQASQGAMGCELVLQSVSSSDTEMTGKDIPGGEHCPSDDR